MGAGASPLGLSRQWVIRVSYCFRVGWLGPNSTVGWGRGGRGRRLGTGGGQGPNKDSPEARAPGPQGKGPSPRDEELVVPREGLGLGAAGGPRTGHQEYPAGLSILKKATEQIPEVDLVRL